MLNFPCNQFGFQQNARGEEILSSLAHIRPGNGFKPNCVMFDRLEVNGENEHPIFTWLKEALPSPADRPDFLSDDPRQITWRPVKRSDISWNFEKFLVDHRGRPRRRYSTRYEPKNMINDIRKLVKAAQKCRSD